MTKRECCMTTNLCCGCRRRILDHHLWHVTHDGRRWHKLCWQKELNDYAASELGERQPSPPETDDPSLEK